MLVIVLPPGEVHRCAVGEVSLEGIVLESYIGDGAPAVVAAGHVDAVEEQVGLDGEELAAGHTLLPCYLLLRQVGGPCLVGLVHYHGCHFGLRCHLRCHIGCLHLGCLCFRCFHFGHDDFGLFEGVGCMEEEDDAGSTQTGEVLAEEAEPELSLVGGAQGGLQLGDVVGEVLVAHGLYVAVVLIAHAAHHDAKRAVVLNIDFHVEVCGHLDVLLDEVEDCLGTLLAEELVEACGAFGRCCATQNNVGQLERVAFDEGEHFVLQLHDERVLLGQVVLVDGEDYLSGQVVELFVGNLDGVILVDELDVWVVLVSSSIDGCRHGKHRECRGGSCPKRNAEDRQHHSSKRHRFC